MRSPKVSFLARIAALSSCAKAGRKLHIWPEQTIPEFHGAAVIGEGCGLPLMQASLRAAAWRGSRRRLR